ncbi:MAG TPA: hypothetical protein VFJ82_22940 [Longimicrobium sp.]|nr:hypothetical protein [Longimicrobium sp.]
MARLALGALLAAALALAGGAATPAADADEAPALLVVVHPGVDAARLDRAEVRRIYLLRRRFWSDGSRVTPVNLPAASPVRDAFSRAALGRPARELADYWNDLYFHGTAPPAVVPSERAVLLFVARTRGAVGYVTRAAYDAAQAEPGAPPVRPVLEIGGG